MRFVHIVMVGVIAAAIPLASMAQFVKGNEAVRVSADGLKKVETPPTAGAVLAAPCLADKKGCGGGGWMMVETNSGLMECTEIYARSGTCRTSTYGSQKLSRLWIVKAAGQWKQCQLPDLGSKCVSTKALPFSAVQ
jgi:hypothetical protein